MQSRKLRVVFMSGRQHDYEVRKGGMWCWKEDAAVLVIRPGPGIVGGCRYPGRYEIPAMNILHVELLEGTDIDA